MRWTVILRSMVRIRWMVRMRKTIEMTISVGAW